MERCTKAVLALIALLLLAGCQVLSPGTGIKSLSDVAVSSDNSTAFFYRIDRAFVGSAATVFVSLNEEHIEMNEGDFWQALMNEGVNNLEVQFPAGIRDSFVFEHDSNVNRYFIVGAIGKKETLIKELSLKEWSIEALRNSR